MSKHSEERARERDALYAAMRTADDELDVWLADTAGQAPGGEFIAYPVETSDRPTTPVSDPSERKARLDAIERIVPIVLARSDEELTELVRRAEERDRAWLEAGGWSGNGNHNGHRNGDPDGDS